MPLLRNRAKYLFPDFRGQASHLRWLSFLQVLQCGMPEEGMGSAQTRVSKAQEGRSTR